MNYMQNHLLKKKKQLIIFQKIKMFKQFLINLMWILNRKKLEIQKLINLYKQLQKVKFLLKF